MDGMNWPPRGYPGHSNARAEQRQALVWALRAILMFNVGLVLAVIVVAWLFPADWAPDASMYVIP
jgi:hypothetical protein